MKLAIDLGASNVKVAAIVKGTEVKFDSFKSLAKVNPFGLSNEVVYKGQKVALGTGTSLIEQDKTERKYLVETILLAAYKMFGSTKGLEIELGVGLPIHTFKSNKRAKLQIKLDALLDIKLEGTVDDQPISVVLTSAKIFAEGYSAFLAVADDLPKGPTTFIDWGYKTSDVISLAIEDGEWTLQEVHTVPVGIYDMLMNMKTALYNNDVDLSAEQIDMYLRTTPNIPTQHGSVNLNAYLHHGKSVVDTVFQELKVVMPNILSTNIYFCGGGADRAKELVGNDYSNIFTLPNQNKAFFANAIGYLNQI